VHDQTSAHGRSDGDASVAGKAEHRSAPATTVRVAGAPSLVLPGLGTFAARLRERGVRAGLNELLVAHRALDAVDAADPRQARLALRAALCARHEDLAAFEAEWAAWLAEHAPEHDPLLDPAAHLALPHVAVPGEADAGVPGPPTPRPAAWSEVELLRERDFAQMTDAERAAARRLLVRLAHRGPRRRSRRLRPSGARRGRPDHRRTVRASLRHGGEPIDRRWHAPGERERPLVLVVDVSGSMAPYARMLLHYVHAAVVARGRVEAFAFGTRLTRITRELRGRDPQPALARATAAAGDWSGGTRIGAALAELNREHGRRVGRGAIVAVLSDGWDRGDPERLATEMARLSRTAYRLVWLNPLKADPRYEPLARGMAAALPYVDDFLSGHSVASLEELADLLEGTAT
jgi:uncharacterized protein with von Willebrand factor type A (vWA) domain